MAAQTGLTVKQVTEWFCRFRKRKLGKSTQDLPNRDISTIPPPAGIDMIESSSFQHKRCPSSQSLERYFLAPAEDEGSPLQTCNSLQSHQSPPRFHSKHNYNTVNSPYFLHTTQPVNMTSIDDHFPSPHSSNQQSSLSFQSTNASEGSTRRKGRRIIPPPQPAPERKDDLKFQCTRCNRGFKFPSDRIRHEKTHTPQLDCVCLRTSPRLISKTGRPTCAFCGDSDPTDEHFTFVHDALGCRQKPEHLRSYSKPDGLMRHMVEKHSATTRPPPDLWIVQKDLDQSRSHWCGFCKEYRPITWEKWGAHTNDHFRIDDYDMTWWTEEPIFETGYMDNRLEN